MKQESVIKYQDENLDKNDLKKTAANLVEQIQTKQNNVIYLTQAINKIDADINKTEEEWNKTQSDKATLFIDDLKMKGVELMAIDGNPVDMVRVKAAITPPSAKKIHEINPAHFAIPAAENAFTKVEQLIHAAEKSIR